MVKTTLKNVNLRGTGFNIGEQNPQEVQQRWCNLIPIMIVARNQNKKVDLLRDKLRMSHQIILNKMVLMLQRKTPVFIPVRIDMSFISWNIEGLTCLDD